MAIKQINEHINEITPSTIIELYIIDTTILYDNILPDSEQVMYFCNEVSETLNHVYFEGQKYKAIPCEWTGQEIKGDGSQNPRPKFKVSNYIGYASRVIKEAGGMLRAKITRKRTFAKFLDRKTWQDSEDFPELFWNSPNVNATLSTDIFFVDKIISENPNFIELELVTSTELDGVEIPRRKMWANFCSFEYRNSSGCGKTGAPSADKNNKKFADPISSVTNGLLAYYAFDESLEASEGSDQITLTPNNATFFYREGKIGKSIQSNTEGNRRFSRAISNIPVGSANRTFSLWFYTPDENDHDSFPCIFAYGTQATGRFFMLTYENHSLAMRVNDGGFVFFNNIQKNKWHHVVVRLDGDNLQDIDMFLNGQKQSGGQNRTINTGTDVNFNIGGYQDGSEFIGRIDEFRIYNRALSDTEINTLGAAVNLGGYGLTLNDRGKWQDGSSYDRGDYVYLESKIQYKEGVSERKRFYYVCLKNNTSTIPYKDIVNWEADQCSKSIAGCKCRFPSNSLPFGGFPALTRADINE